ncbi:hypothetical protein [Chelatococcus reniformis]|uniref:Uncharacterized protein n=1 Tax=Chelatococcus reniformis TaxID=1494448 RepID=A0A916UFV9_9HYPH|nr:hypothetical protein [Chelatococcus reniformis]GGC70760.1 hypothetical protein GCM10010994_31650 [Chelatococcus reniformis]
MKIDAGFQPKQLVEIEPGELFVADFGGGPEPAVMLPADEHYPRCLLLTRLANNKKRPSLHDLKDNTEMAITFGKDWILTPKHGPKLFDGNQYLLGALHISAEAAVLVTYNPRGSYTNNVVFLDLLTMQLVNRIPDRSLVVESADIWLSEEQRRLPGAKPFLTIVPLQV